MAQTVRWIVVGSLVAFVLVEGIVAWQAFFRRDAEPAPLRGFRRRRLELAWMLTPALILLTLVVWTGSVLGRDVRNVPSAPDVVVHVTGHQFYWQLRYELPARDGAQDGAQDGAAPRLVEVANNQLHLPEGKVAKLILDSADVVHGFWVPQFRIKETIAPGAGETIWMQPMEKGDFNIVCAELCGNSHYAMRGFVHVDAPADFEKWLASNAVSRETGK